MFNLKGKISQEQLLLFLFLLSVFLLSLFKTAETDFWMHISIGRLIWDLKGLPAHELFPYTMTDKPFLYTSWLFGLIYYLTYQAFNIYGVILLKGITVTSAFYILLKDSTRPYKNYVVSIVILGMVVLAARGRFVERPDTFLMVFLSFSIFSLNAFVYDNRKYIYALPLVHLIWANSHSSINLMFVPFLSFITGGALQIYLGKKDIRLSNTPSANQLKTIMIVFLLSSIATLLNPNFTGQFAYGPGVLSSAWKHKIMEFFPPTWETDKWPYLISVAAVVIFALEWIMACMVRNTEAEREYPSFVPIMLVLPFIFLAFNAVRFIPILAIVSGPILARSLSALLNSEGRNRFFHRKVVLISVAVSIFVFTVSVMDYKRFGFGIVEQSVPEGALKYMDRKGIEGRVFNEFGWGGYIVWRDFPGRNVFIDPRTQLSPEILDKFLAAEGELIAFDDLEKRYGFESVLVADPLVVSPDLSMREYGAAQMNPNWALVYWDDRSLVYLKRGGRYEDVIKEDEYKIVRPLNNPAIYKARLQDSLLQAELVAELKRNISETASAKANVLLGFVYNETGNYKEAIDSYSKVRGNHISKGLIGDALRGIGYAYDRLGNSDRALESYKSALSVHEDAETFYELGIIYAKRGDKKPAINYLKKALKADKNFVRVYVPLIDIYREQGDSDKVFRLTSLYEQAKVLASGGEHFNLGLDAYRKRDYPLAINEFMLAIEATPSDPAAYGNLGYVYYDMGMLDKALEYQKKAISLDPNLADAHYGLALIYAVKGDNEYAVRHFKEYLRIEPIGQFSTVAKEEIKRLEK